MAEAVQAELQGVRLHGAYGRGVPERGRAIMDAHALEMHWDSEQSALEKSGDKTYSDLLQAPAILQHKSVCRRWTFQARGDPEYDGMVLHAQQTVKPPEL